MYYGSSSPSSIAPIPTPSSGSSGSDNSFKGLVAPSIVPPKQGFIPQDVSSFITQPNISGPIPSPTGGTMGIPPTPGDSQKDIWQQGSDFFGSVLGTAVKAVETPFSLANEATKPVFGSGGLIGATASALDQTPVGAVARAGEWALNQSQNLVGSYLNQPIASLLANTRGKSDSTPIDFGTALSSGWTALPFFPALLASGLADVNTVGELRALATKRGFTPQDVQDIYSGKMQPYQFGSQAISPNPLANTIGRFVYDPLNVAFLGGPAVAKEALSLGLKITGAGAEVVPELAKAGVYAAKAVDPASSAIAIANGDAAKATWQGLGTYLHDATRSVAPKLIGGTVLADAGIVGFDTLTGTASDIIGKQTPIGGLLGQMHQVSSDIINDRPLSQSSIFALTAAMLFPLHEVAGMAKDAVSGARTNLIGGAAEGAVFKTMLPSDIQRLPIAEQRTWAEQNINGGVASIVDHADQSIAYKQLMKYGGVTNHFRSLPSAVMTVAQIAQAVDEKVQQMRADGRISNDMRIREIKSWTEDQRAYTENTPAGVDSMTSHTNELRMAYTPELALEQWNRGMPVFTHTASILQSLGNVTVGLNSNFTAERVDAMMSVARSMAQDGKLKAADMRSLMIRFPEIGQVASQGEAGNWWQQFLNPSAPAVELGSVTGRMSNFKKLLPDVPEVTADATLNEMQAPPAAPRNIGVMDQLAAQDAQTMGSAVAAELAKIDQTHLTTAAPAALTDAEMASLNWSAPMKGVLGELTTPKTLEEGTTQAPPASVNGLTLDNMRALAPYQKVLDEYGTPFTLTFAPENPLIWSAPGEVDPRLLQHTALAETVLNHGALSAVPRFLEALTKPVSNYQMNRDATAAIYDELVGKKGLAADDVQKFLGKLAEEHNTTKLFNVNLYRGRTGLMPSAIEAIAKDVFGSNGKKDYAKFIEKGDNFQRAIDRASNRAWRKVQADVRVGTPGAMERAWNATYEGFQKSKVGNAGRMLKVYYPIFRFMSDPRWWMMNYFEADMLSTFRNGMKVANEGRAYRGWDSMSEAEKTTAAQAAMPEYTQRYGSVTLDRVKELLAKERPDEGGEVWARNMGGYIASDFNENRISSTADVINKMASTDPAMASLERLFGPNKGTWAQQLDNMLYQFDQKGARKTFEEERVRLGKSDGPGKGYNDPNFRKLMNVIADENQKTFNTVTNIYAGNAARSNVERVLNSYWLYWPLSYQLKAGKWMFDVLTKDGVFGKNLTGAYWYNHVRTSVENELASNPQMQKQTTDLSALFNFTQMLFPITPSDLGVSLNRLDRYVGGYLGLWPPYNKASDLLSLSASMIEMGPIYTYNLLKQIKGGLQKQHMLPALKTSIPEELGVDVPAYTTQQTP